MRGEFLTWIYCCQKYKNWHWDPCNEVLHCCRRNFVHTEYMLNLFNRSLMVWSEEIIWGRLKVLWGKDWWELQNKQNPNKNSSSSEGSEKKDDNQEFFDAEIRRRTGPIGSLLPPSRSLVCFSSRARGFSRATSFSAPMIKIGNIAVVACPRADDGLLRT